MDFPSSNMCQIPAYLTHSHQQYCVKHVVYLAGRLMDATHDSRLKVPGEFVQNFHNLEGYGRVQPRGWFL